jgi:hypothetical protein
MLCASDRGSTSMTGPLLVQAWRTIIDVIESVFESRLGPELIDQVSRMDRRRLNLFVDAYLEYRMSCPAALTVPPKAHELDIRPRVLRHFGQIREMSSRVYGGWMDPSGDPFRFMDRLTYPLLYCHSIAIDNPLVELADERLEWTPDTPASPLLWTEIDRRQLTSYLSFVNDAKPLIRDNILVLLEPSGPYAHASIDSQMERGAAIANSRVTAIRKFWLTGKGYKRLKSVPRDAKLTSRARRDAFAMAMIDLYSDVGLSAASRGQVDLFVPHSSYEVVLKAIADDAASLVGSMAIRDAELRVLADLVSAELPGLNLAAISAADLVAIRRSDDVFETWRTNLGQVAEELASIDPTIIDRSDAARVAISRHLAEDARALRDRVKADGRLGRSTLKRIALGAIARLPSASAKSLRPDIGMAREAGGAVIELLDLYASRGQRQIRKAYFNHYLVFSPFVRGLDSN